MSDANNEATSTYTPVLITSFPSNPLTTTFTPPAPCSGIYWSDVGMIDDQTSCLPSGFQVSATDFFSPGIACPSGYYSACHDTTGVASITTVTCCPFRGSITLSCVDPATLNSVWSTLFCTWMAGADGAEVTMTLSSNGVTSTITSTMVSREGLNAFGVRMVHESTDITSTTSGSATGTETADPSQSTTASSSPSESSGLSTGAIVAIAVVIPVVVLALAGGLFFWWRKRKQRYNAVASAGSPGSQKETPAPLGNYTDETPQELSGNWGQPVELSDRNQLAFELPAELRR